MHQVYFNKLTGILFSFIFFSSQLAAQKAVIDTVDFSLNKQSNESVILESKFLGSPQINIENASTLLFMNNVKTDDSTVSFRSTRSKNALEFRFNNPAIKSINFWFQEDTIDKFQYIDSAFSNSRIVFNWCVLNSEVSVEVKDSSNQKLKFHGCSLTNGVTCSNVDTLEIFNCRIQGDGFTIFNSGGNKLVVNILETDMSKINIELLGNTELYYDTSEFFIEESRKTFELLIKKYQDEGRTSEYEYLDGLYKKHKHYQDGYWGRLADFFDKYWWGYRHDNSRIVIWTIGFLTLFFLINLVLGNKILSFYPILIYKVTPRWIERRKEPARKFIRILVLTLFIFFSLKIDFAKIDASRTRLMGYFFLQYFIGLICLFFLFRVVFTL